MINATYQSSVKKQLAEHLRSFLPFLLGRWVWFSSLFLLNVNSDELNLSKPISHGFKDREMHLMIWISHDTCQGAGDGKGD